MTPFNQYASLQGISDRTLYRWIKAGDVLKIERNGEPFIIDNAELKINDPKAIEAVKKMKRVEWDRAVLQVYQALTNPNYDPYKAHSLKKELFAAISEEVKHWAIKGVVIKGYELKSLYRKLKKGKVARTRRCDRGVRKNNILKSPSVQSKLLAVAWHVFGKPAAAYNISLMCDKVKEFAQQNEDFYELAGIPKVTMYRFLADEFEACGADKAHLLMNHYNLAKQTRARNIGAFTSDVQFMDYIIGDDHKSDIDKVLVWDEVRKEYRKETVRGWYWIEGKTQKILSYVCVARDITAEDVKLSLLEALQSYGKPNVAVMVDNGVGKSADVLDFCLKAGVTMEFSKPYEPTHKATVERIFGYVKNEFDVYFENYVGNNHEKEGRHRSSKLSPEECTVTYEEYSKKLHNYINGFFETRERQRVLDNKKIKISIRDFFDTYWKNHTKQEIEDRILRFAYQKMRVKRYNNGLQLTINKQVYNYMPSPDLSPVFNGRPYEVYYNENDMNRVDLYAANDFIDKTDGKTVLINKGAYITTLESFSLYTMSQRKAKMAEKNRAVTKHLRHAVDALIDKSIVSTVNAEGIVTDNRKKAKKEILAVIKDALPLDKIETIVVKASEVKTIGQNDLDILAEAEKVEITEDDWRELND